MTTNLIPPFEPAIVEGIADVLGETQYGLTGSEIARTLAAVRIPDVSPTITKRHRLREALAARQARDGAGNCVVAFIREAMSPVKYRNDPALHSRRQDDLNEVLIHAALRVKYDGQVARLREGAATTLDEAARRAGKLRTELRRRGTHPDVLRYCTDELLQRDNFHAVHEAAKSIPDRLRVLTGRVDDGADLINATVTPSSGPVVAINAGRTPSDRSEQSGLANYAIGLLSLYRNPTSHETRLRRKVDDDELLEALTAISMVHRRLDDATVAQAS